MYLKEKVHLYSARSVSIPGMVVGTLLCGNNGKLNEDVKAKKKKRKYSFFQKLDCSRVGKKLKRIHVKETFCLFLRCLCVEGRKPRHAHN